MFGFYFNPTGYYPTSDPLTILGTLVGDNSFTL
jgi:hypothetical protein